MTDRLGLFGGVVGALSNLGIITDVVTDVVAGANARQQARSASSRRNVLADECSVDPRLTEQQILELAARSKKGPPIRTHTSATPLLKLRAVRQNRRMTAMGLWFDLHGAWIGHGLLLEPWTRAFYVGLEKDDIVSGRYLYRVDLGDSDVLRISTAAAFDAFEERYATRYEKTRLHFFDLPTPTRPWQENTEHSWTDVMGRQVDWRAVARDYDAIEIAPPRRDRPGKTAAHAWYSDFDDIPVGGCVWRPRGVSLTFLGRVPGEISGWTAPNP